MKKLYLTSLLLCWLLPLCAQTLNFKDGKLQTMPPVNVSASPVFLATCSNCGLSTADRSAITDTLNSIASRALLNIEDNTLKLKKFYEWLWGSGNFSNYERELQGFQVMMTSNSRTLSARHVPDGTAVTTLLGMPKYVTLADVVNNKKHTIRVVKNDVYKQWILNRYNTLYLSTVQRWNTQGYIDAFDKGWVELEDLYEKLSEAKKGLITVQQKYEDCSKAISKSKSARSDARSIFTTNSVISHFKVNRDFYLGWLWYNDGILSTNPLYIVQPGRDYPVTWKFTAMNAEVSKLVGGFRRQGQQLLTNEQLYNLVEIPEAKNENRNRRELWHMLMDGSSIQDNELSARAKLLTEEDEMTLCIHNVKVGQELVVTFDTTPVSDKGPFTDGAMVAVDSFALAYRSVLGLSGLGKFVSNWTGLGGRSINIPKITASMGTSNQTEAANVYYAPDGGGGVGGATVFALKQKIIERQPAKPTDTIAYVNGLAVKLNYDEFNAPRIDENNKRALLAVYKRYETEINLTDPLIEAFLKDELRHTDNMLVFDSENELQESVEAFFERLKDFVDKLDKCDEDIKTELKELDEQLFYVMQLLQINERSLPPLTLANVPLPNDAIPQYSTRTYEMPVKVRSKIGYNVAVKETKKINDRDVEQKTILFKSSYKIGGLYRFMPGAGFAYVIPDYTNNQVSTDNNNMITKIEAVNPRIMAIVGLHIYPWKFYSLDGRSIFKTIPGSSADRGGFRHRVSVFAGLGIAKGKALDHFFIGPSLDIYTGLKLTAGAHLYKYTRYEINSNQVLGIHPTLKCNYFMGVTVDPALFVKFFNIFN